MAFTFLVFGFFANANKIIDLISGEMMSLDIDLRDEVEEELIILRA